MRELKGVGELKEHNERNAANMLSGERSSYRSLTKRYSRGHFLLSLARLPISPFTSSF